MDILLQYLNIRSQKQTFVKITDVPCYTVFQAIHPKFELNVPYKALGLMSTLERLLGSNFFLTGIVDAAYCNRKTCVEYSYVDFCQLTSGPGETSGID